MRLEIYSAVSGFGFMDQLVKEMGALGYSVCMVSSLTANEYRNGKSMAMRLWNRLIIYVGFPLKVCIRVIWASLRGDVSVRMATTSPFYTPALVQMMSFGQAIPVVCLVYDLYPDALIAANVLKREANLTRWMASITKYAIRRSAKTIYLGQRLARHAEECYGPSRNFAVIPVGADGSKFSAPPQALGGGDVVQCLYVGNMGYMHDTDTLQRLLAETFPADVAFHFYSSGAKFRQLQDSVLASCGDARSKVFFSDPLPDVAWKRVSTEGHVALVTMIPGAEKVVFPSKTFSALMAGQAIIAICPADSDLAELVNRHDCGWQIDPGDVDSLRSVVQNLSADKGLLQVKRVNAFRTGHELYDMPVIAAQLAKELL